MDMANHQSTQQANNVVAFEYFANAYSLSTTVDETVKNNQELFISYGPRSNDQLLQYYGFVEVDNQHDVYIMPPLRDWDIAALEQACGRTFSNGRLQKLDKAGLLGISSSTAKLDLEAENRGGGVVLSRMDGLDPAVLTALRVLVSSDDEWMAAGEAIGNFAADNSGGATNERLARIAAVTALQLELDSKDTTLEQDIQLLRQSKNNMLDDDDYEQNQLALAFRIEKKKLLKETIKSLQNSYSSA
uniref:Rubisco LSMT substrate-binding domain-containing protein n=1 Tax=Eucampia antarctica TaxID=49252 RepID=A0A7S2S8I0_9STRA|mmetsp:Transcript_4562/g.4320  ORF Transcript_4562/g.4320 Transcript_4562/m.4320 type:complete len:245 (+) Transcript_4562:159-893(+)